MVGEVKLRSFKSDSISKRGRVYYISSLEIEEASSKSKDYNLEHMVLRALQWE